MNVYRHPALQCSVLLAGLGLLTAGGRLEAQADRARPGEYAEADIAFGARLYEAQCSSCHGPTGNSVSGVDLRSGKFRNASTDQQLTNLITNGIPGTGMVGFKQLTGPELTGLVAYLRNMSTFDARAVRVGDVGRGRALFEGKGGCTTCHRADGRGAGLAPDLVSIGTLRTAAALETSVLDPSRAMVPINRPVRAVTKEGRTINGRRLNEDTYTVQMVDDQGRLASLVKADLREYTVLTASPMPAYQGKLTSAEVADVVAYLLSLRGR